MSQQDLSESILERFPMSQEPTLEHILFQHREALTTYEGLLRHWQKALNLVSSGTLDAFWDRHVRDSAQLLPFLDLEAPLGDCGSGAGFPGLILALLGAQAVHLIESDQRKCLFLEEVMRATGVRAHLHSRRFEHMTPDLFPGGLPRTWVARAFASIDQIFTWSEGLRTAGTRYVLLKGARADEEINDALKKWVFRVEKHPSLTHAGAFVVVLQEVARR